MAGRNRIRATRDARRRGWMSAAHSDASACGDSRPQRRATSGFDRRDGSDTPHNAGRVPTRVCILGTAPRPRRGEPSRRTAAVRDAQRCVPARAADFKFQMEKELLVDDELM
jgi:hypothetical protein